MNIFKVLQVGIANRHNRVDRIDVLCNSVLKNNPRDVFSLWILADVYWRNGKFEQALPYAIRTLEVEPHDFEAIRIAAQTYYERGDHEVTYQYAKSLCSAPDPYIAAKAVSKYLKYFDWVNKIRCLRKNAVKERRRKQLSCRRWRHWAQAYVEQHEAQSSLSSDDLKERP
ncbi:hypothetical protein GCM10027046_02930 [Uliginosibacterium flavum]|uniref:Tetratricopeptide repeat protein n=1 Tax=Uliginosibacterium flavum TaxID=1396831 RepID=A0ABV2TIY3_9RHOO